MQHRISYLYQEMPRIEVDWSPKFEAAPAAHLLLKGSESRHLPRLEVPRPFGSRLHYLQSWLPMASPVRDGKTMGKPLEYGSNLAAPQRGHGVSEKLEFLSKNSGCTWGGACISTYLNKQKHKGKPYPYCMPGLRWAKYCAKWRDVAPPDGTPQFLMLGEGEKRYFTGVDLCKRQCAMDKSSKHQRSQHHDWSYHWQVKDGEKPWDLIQDLGTSSKDEVGAFQRRPAAHPEIADPLLWIHWWLKICGQIRLGILRIIKWSQPIPVMFWFLFKRLEVVGLDWLDC